MVPKRSVAASDHGLNLAVVGHVGRHRQGLNPQRLGVGRGSTSLVDRSVVVDHHVGAGSGQGQGDAPADPLGSPSYQSRPAGKIHRQSMPPGHGCRSAGLLRPSAR